MSISRPNIVQQENRLKGLPDEALRAMLIQMGQNNQVGSPEYLLAAGEMQARKKVREQAQMGQPQQPPVIAELLTGIPMQGGMPQPQGQPQQSMPMGPEDAGVAALPAQNLEALDQPEYADGGIVAFQKGASVRNPFLIDEMDAIDRMTPEERNAYYRKKFQAREGSIPRSSTSPFPPRRAPGVAGLVGKAAGIFGPALTLGWDQLYGTSDEDMGKLRAFDAAKERLKSAGFTDKDIDAMPRETVYRMASGYQPQARQVAGPSTPGDLRKLEAAAGDPYVTGRGLTPEQSAANIAAARPPIQPKDEGLGALAAPSAYADLMTQAKQFAEQISPETEKLPSITDSVAAQKEALKAAGFDFGLIKNQIAEIRAEKEQSKADRKEATNLRLLEAGLGIMAGESPYAFVNIGKGAAPALKGLSDDIKEIKKIDRERDKAMRDLAVADNQIASGMGLAALKSRDAAQERIARANENRATREASIFSTLTSADTQRFVAQQGLAAAKEGRAETRQDARMRNALEQANDVVDKMARADYTLANDPARQNEIRNTLYNQFLQRLSGAAPTGASAGPRGRVVNGVYVPAGQ